MTTFDNVTPKKDSGAAADVTVHQNKYAITPELLSSRPQPKSTGLEVRKPNKNEIVTIVGGSTPMIPCLINKIGQESSKYDKEVFHPIAPIMQQQLAGVFNLMQFHLAVNSGGIFFVWPQKLPRLDGSTNSWTESATTVVAAAKRGWVEVRSDKEAGSYRVRASDSSKAIPSEYPSLDAEFERSLGGDTISDEGHAIFKNTRYADALKIGSDKGSWQ